MVPSIAEVVRQFKQAWTIQLEPQAIEDACREAGLTWRDRLLNPVVTVQLFFLQVLNGNTACTHLRHLAGVAFTATAYCQARMRVNLEVFQTLLSRVAGVLGQGTLDTGLWLGTASFWSMARASPCPMSQPCGNSSVYRAGRRKALVFLSRTG